MFILLSAVKVLSRGAKEVSLVPSRLFLLPQLQSADQEEAWASSVLLGEVLSGTRLALTSPLPTELHSLGYRGSSQLEVPKSLP